MSQIKSLEKIFSAFFISIVLSSCGSDNSSPKSDFPVSDKEEYLHSILEGDEGNTVVTIEYSSSYSGVVSYEAYNITAAQKSDFQAVSGEYELSEGGKFLSEVTIFSDNKIEGDEEFGFKIVSQDGVVLFDEKIQIVNDDFPKISVSQPEISELDIGTARLRFEFSLDEPVVDDFELNIASLSGSQISTVDRSVYKYIAEPGIDFEVVEENLIFTAGVTSLTLDVSVLSEDLIENNEYVLLTVVNNQGFDLLDDKYAVGVIRSDETPSVNGFDFQVDNNGLNLSEIKEGSVQEGEVSTWQTINLEFLVEDQDNINQEQNIKLRVLSLDDYSALIGNQVNGYVSSGIDAPDLCLNDASELPSSSVSCLVENHKTIKPGDSTISFGLHINQDLIREDNEAFALVLENDQGVHFTTVTGVIINDDREELFLFYPGLESKVSLEEFDDFIILSEPENDNDSITYNLELSLETEISNVYSLNYEVKIYTVIDPANSTEYEPLTGELTFTSEIKENVIPITLHGDGRYDGDKYIEVSFSSDSGLDPLRIKIKDLNFPSVQIVENSDIAQGTLSINGAKIDYIPISEQDDPDYSVNAGNNKTYYLTLDLVSTNALSDLDYIVSYSSVQFSSEEERDESECSNANLPESKSRLKNTDFDAGIKDFNILSGGSVVESGSMVRIRRGAPGFDWQIEVLNDSLIECNEIFEVSFLPVGIENAESYGASQYFVIDNKDGFEVTISGAQIDEGTKEKDSDLETTAALNISTNKQISADFLLKNITDYASDNGEYQCADGSVENVDKDIQFDASVSFNASTSASNLNHSITVFADSVVEPPETCQFQLSHLDEMTSLEGYRIPVKINHDANESSNVELLINNDDVFDIVFDIDDEQAEPEIPADTASIGTYTWNQQIAPNVGKIAVVANVAGCDSGKDCVEESDTSLGFTNSDPLKPQEIVIHTGNESEVISPITTDLPINIIGDDTIENTETLNINFVSSEDNGSAYIKSLSYSEKSVLITSEDTLSAFFEEIKENNTCGENSNTEIACAREFAIKYSSDNSDAVITDLEIAIAETENNTSTIKSNENDDRFIDAAIFFKSEDKTEFTPLYPEESGEYLIDLIKGSLDQNPIIKVQFYSDTVVEVDETLSLNLVGFTDSDPDEASSNIIIEQTIINTDTVNLFVTGNREVKEPNEPFTPFTLTWEEDIDIAEDNDQPRLTYKLGGECSVSKDMECLDASDYVLAADEALIVLNNDESKSISLENFQIQSDNLVELPERISLVLQHTSSVIESVIHTNNTQDDRDDISAEQKAEDEPFILNWDLVVTNDDQLQLDITKLTSESISEHCEDTDTVTCSQTKTLATIAFDDGVTVAPNGPTIELNVTNACVENTKVTPPVYCAQASEETNANASEKDYVFVNEKIVLHKYPDSVDSRDFFDTTPRKVQVTLNDDDWVEVDETIALNLKPADGSSAYIKPIIVDEETEEDVDWSYSQNITLQSEDVAEFSLERIADTEISTCKFETNTTSFTEPDESCNSLYTLSVSHSIAKEVATLKALLARQDTTSEFFTFKEDDDDDVFDAVFSLKQGGTTSSEFIIPLHTKGTATNKSTAHSTLSIAYNPDTRVEIDEVLDYKLTKNTDSNLYVINREDNKINETVKNDDLIKLEISGNTLIEEPSGSDLVAPYSINWGAVLELPETNRSLTLKVDECDDEVDEKKVVVSSCMSLLESEIGDYTFVSSIVLPNNSTTQEQDLGVEIYNDNLVELPEKLNLSLETGSEYVESIEHKNISSSLTKWVDVEDPEDHLSLGWSSKVTSDDKLTAELIPIDSQENLITSLNESCDTSNDKNCATVKVSTLKVTGTVASNGPNITLNVSNACTNNSEVDFYCAEIEDDVPAEDDINSETDFVINSGGGDHPVHDRSKAISWKDIDIELTLIDDTWVEVEENIVIDVTAETGGSYVTLPADQTIKLVNNDVAIVSIARNDDVAVSTCQFIDESNSFTETGCGDDNKISRYDVSLDRSIAKEVSNIQVALDFTETPVQLVFQDDSEYVEGDDLKLTLDGNLKVPSDSRQLIIDVHSKSTHTNFSEFSPEVEFSYYNDALTETNEQLSFTFKKQDNSNALYQVPTISDNPIVYNETIIDDDAIAFTIEDDTNNTVAEGAKGTSLNIVYTFSWTKAITENIGVLVFDLVDTGSAEEGVDFKITDISDDRLTYNAETRQLTFTNDIENTGKSISFNLQIQGDDLVETDETIQLSFTAADSNTSEQAAISSIISKTIQNDDTLTVTVYSNDNADEGDGSVLSLTQPFSYTLNKDIAADVPTIELYMDLTCINSGTVNCIEYSGADPLPQTNDIVFANTQYLTLHTGPNDDEPGVYTQSVDPVSEEQILKVVPVNHATDDRVEANETLTINFAKEGGVLGTNPGGRSYIVSFVNGDDVEETAVDSMSKSVVIINDDKLDLFISDTTCSITAEDSSTCVYEINWQAAFDMQDVLGATSDANTLEGELVTIKNSTDAQAMSTNNTANSTPEYYSYDRWNVSSYIDLASTAKSNASTSITNIQSADNDLDTALANANLALDLAETTEEENAATNAINLTSASIAMLADAKDAADSAITAANAALTALEKAKRAGLLSGGLSDAVDAAIAATSAANDAVAKANKSIQHANKAVLLSALALQSTVTPVVDDDAGEISLSLTHSGTTNLTDVFLLDEDDKPTSTVLDPQDYQVNWGGASQDTQITLKEAGAEMLALPRTLSISPVEDNFMEPAESINVSINEIEQTDNFEYINSFAGFNYSSIIAENDTATVTVSSSTASGDEGVETDVDIEYAVNLSNPISKNYGTIAFTADLNKDSTVEDDDYSIAGLAIHSMGTATLTASPLILTTKADKLLEHDENVILDLSVPANTVTQAGITSIQYEILNDDAVIVNITTPSGDISSEEADADIELTYTITSSHGSDEEEGLLIAADYDNFDINVSTTGSTASIGNSASHDAKAPGKVSYNVSKPVNHNATQTQTLEINHDTIVEKPEDVVMTFTSAADSNDVRINVNSAETVTNILTYTITNNDYIQIDYRCGGTQTCGGALGESGSTDIRAEILAAYTTEGLSDEDLTIVFTQGEEPAENPATLTADYSLASVILPSSVSSGDLNDINSGLASLVSVETSDDVIEKTEHFNLVKPNNDFVTTTYMRTDYTIANDDYLTVSLKTIEPTSDTTDYKVQRCIPTGKSIQGGDITFTATLQEVEDVPQLTCTDIGMTAGGTIQCSEGDDIVTGSFVETIAAGDIPQCGSVNENRTLFTFVAPTTIQPNKWFNIEITSDERCDTATASGNCIDAHNVIVQNTQLTNLLDTGATQCLQGREKRWAGDCASVDDGDLKFADDSEDLTDVVNYAKQDAAQTDGTNNIYPALAYTHINNDGEPVTSKPDGDNDKPCVQDNNTGFIWSGTVLDPNDSNSNIRPHNFIESITEAADYDCSIANVEANPEEGVIAKAWQLPSIQDLMTILDTEQLMTAREFGIRFTANNGSNILVPQFYKGISSEHFAKYWSSTSCASNNFYTLNFLNGEVGCEHKNNENSIMLLYK